MRNRLKKKPAQAIKFIETLRIPEGPQAGKRFRLLPWQRNFIAGALDDKNQYAILSCGRGAGKTMLSAALALTALMGIWDNQPNRQIICAAKTAEQARILWAYTKSLIETLPEAEQAKFSIKQAPRLEIHYEGNGNAMLKAIAANAQNALGLSPAPIIICDETGHWPDAAGSELFAALESSMGKRMAKMILISTSASSDTHFFSRLIDEPYDNAHVVEHRAPEGLPLDDLDGLKAANPSAVDGGAGASIEWLQEQARRAIKRGGHAASSFRLYHLNQRVSADNTEMLIDVDNWMNCEVDELPPRKGPVVVALDAGESASMSAVAYFWPETKRLECYATFPSNPSLEDRGINDHVAGQYVEMRDRGELTTMGDLTVPLPQWLEKCLDHVKGETVQAIVLDRFKQATLQQTLTALRVTAPVVWRGMGFASASEDINRLRNAVYDGDIKTLPSLLLRNALKNTVIVRDDADNMKTSKRRSKSRIDAACAVILAVSEAQRRAEIPAPRAARIAWG